MSAWPTIDLVFAGAAIVGGVAFLAWLVLQFVGGGHSDADIDLGDVDAGSADVSGEADISFTVLSFQGLSSFFTIFGLVGLAAHREAHTGALVALGAALIAGSFCSWVIARLFAFFRNLQSSGTESVATAVGEEGSVYLRIPAQGEGKVSLAIRNRYRVLDAVAEHGEELEHGARVKVVRVTSDDVLVVTRLV